MKNNIWIFETKADRFFDLKRYIGNIKDANIFDTDTVSNRKKKVGHIKQGILFIKKGYQWDGCTPKTTLFNRVIGVPDFKRTKDASLVHDFLIEYCAQHSISRKENDTIFRLMLKEKRFKLRFVYAGVVDLYRIVINRNKC